MKKVPFHAVAYSSADHIKAAGQWLQVTTLVRKARLGNSQPVAYQVNDVPLGNSLRNASRLFDTNNPLLMLFFHHPVVIYSVITVKQAAISTIRFISATGDITHTVS